MQLAWGRLPGIVEFFVGWYTGPGTPAPDWFGDRGVFDLWVVGKAVKVRAGRLEAVLERLPRPAFLRLKAVAAWLW